MKAVDWTRVHRATLDVQQRYWYTYTAPVTNMHQRLVMIPPEEHGAQRLRSFDLEVLGADQYQTTWDTDQFGNRVCHVEVARVQERVEFAAAYTVERWRGDISPTGDWSIYREPTALTAPDERLRAAAESIAARADNDTQRADLAHEWAAKAITYQLGVTGVRTPAAMALHLGHGVCQDYAHLLLCVLRIMDIPARYVSGQLLGEGVPHAWVEVLAENQVLAFDPTHHRRTGLDYVTVAIGRDFADVTPTSGVFSGAAIGVLHAAKKASVRSVRPLRSEAAA